MTKEMSRALERVSRSQTSSEFSEFDNDGKKDISPNKSKEKGKSRSKSEAKKVNFALDDLESL